MSALSTRRTVLFVLFTLATLALGSLATAALAVIVRPPPPPIVLPTAPPAAPPPQVVLVPHTTVIPMPVPPPEGEGPCPAKHTSPSPVLLRLSPDLALRSVTTSRFDVRRLAAWNDDHVYASTDEGRTFQRVLDGAAHVVDAVFDCHGRLWVLRADGMLGRYDGAGEADHIFPILRSVGVEPDVYGARLVPHDGVVVVLASDPADRDRLIALRRDEHHRWQTASLLAGHDDGEWAMIHVDHVESRGGDRVRFVASTYTGGECGTSAWLDATIDVRTLRTLRYRRFTEDEHERVPVPRHRDDMIAVTSDLAGRTVGIPVLPYGEDTALLRLTPAELAARDRPVAGED
jgi:hypothetical protein